MIKVLKSLAPGSGSWHASCYGMRAALRARIRRRPGHCAAARARARITVSQRTRKLVVTGPWQKNAACSAGGHKPNASWAGGGEVAQETGQRGAGGGADRPLAVVLPSRAARGRSAPVGGRSEGWGEVRAPCVAPVPHTLVHHSSPLRASYIRQAASLSWPSSLPSLRALYIRQTPSLSRPSLHFGVCRGGKRV